MRIGIDLGGTKIEGIVLDDSGKERARVRVATPQGSYEATVDIFNVLNANHVLLQLETIGSTLGRPSRILSPRVVRLGITARF